MLGVVVSASRRALAAVVVLVAGWLAVWVAAFRVGNAIVGTGKAPPPGVSYGPARCAVGTGDCIAVRPGWTIPVAVAIALVGIALAFWLHRARRGRGELRAVGGS